ncbi:uronyl 2-sulfotransferase-like [Macrobrachium rosenbergii]|uniref:uronyl 2-sulfotransferase-like n=1 Tax=Macrobrachium rosenbergii TaxID=79674 RepID=UPI0034D5190B
MTTFKWPIPQRFSRIKGAFKSTRKLTLKYFVALVIGCSLVHFKMRGEMKRIRFVASNNLNSFDGSRVRLSAQTNDSKILLNLDKNSDLALSHNAEEDQLGQKENHKPNSSNPLGDRDENLENELGLAGNDAKRGKDYEYEEEADIDYDEEGETEELEDEEYEEDQKQSNQTTGQNTEQLAPIEKLKKYPILPLPIYVNEGGRPQVHKKYVKENLNTQVIPSARNVTPENTRLVIYNRVPKCGSTTVNTIINRLHLKNKFHHRHSKIYNKHWLNEEERKALTRKLFESSKTRPLCFDRHIYYFNTTRLGFPRTALINLVREPVKRFISQFYFTRSRSRWQRVAYLKSRPRPPNWWFDLKLDDCIQAKRPECFPHPEQEMSLQLTFFCGHHPECRKLGSRWALYRAKRHVESYYSVVGLLEEMPLSLSVLEGYLPRFFKGVRNIPESSGDVKLNAGESHQRNSISNSTKEVIKGFLKEDIEFYEFVRQRLHLQAKKLGLLE